MRGVALAVAGLVAACVAVVRVHDHVLPRHQLLVVLRGEAHQLAEDDRREGVGELGDEVEGVLREHLVDEVLGVLLEMGLELRHRIRREPGVEDALQAVKRFKMLLE